MDKRIELKGYWWLPKNPDKRVAGVLIYEPREKIVLELIGTFHDCPVKTFLSEESGVDEKIIHGFSSDAKNITLINCFSSGSLNFSSPFPIIRYSTQYLVIGKHLEAYDQECFFKAHITLPELSHWCPPNALSRSMEFTEDARGKIEQLKEINISLASSKISLATAQISESTQLSIKSTVAPNFEGFSMQIEEHSYLELLKLDNSAFKLSDVLAYTYLFEQFLSLATLQNVECSSITLFDKSESQEGENRTIYHPIEFIKVQKGGNCRGKIEQSDLLFSHESIKHQFPEIIKKWYSERREIAPIRRHLISSLSENKVFSSVDFLIVAQALDGFYSRFRKGNGKRVSFSNKIEWLIDEFSDIDQLAGDKIDLKQVRDSRHYYSHFMSKSEKPHTLDGWALYELTFKLRKLLICCVLNFIGLDNSQTNDVLNESDNRLVRN